MTDRQPSFEGLHRSQKSLDTFSSYRDIDLAATGAQLASPVPRRRPSRTNDLQSASSIWVDTPSGESRNVRSSRTTPRRSSKTSPRSATGPDPPVQVDKVAAGFFPKLGRILEGKENKAHRRHWDSTAGPEEQSTPARRRRPLEHATLSRRPTRQKQGSLQRRVESLVNIQNPSMISVLSGLTQQSNVSGGSNDSNTTVTQQSYDRSQLAKRKPIKVRKRAPMKRGPAPVRKDTMDDHPSGVFQYLNGSSPSEQFHSGQLQPTDRPSTGYSSSSVTSSETDDDNLSSDGHERGPEVESPLTSPASMRKSYHQDSHDEDDGSGSGMSVREASPLSHHQPSVSDDMEDSDEQGEGDESSEYSDDDEAQDNASATDELVHQQHHARQMALERIPPPRLPSASSSSRNSDRHTRRLRRQEQALSEHVLQAPRPQRDFHFNGGPSPQTLPSHPGMPLYDPYSHPGSSPAAFYATAHHAPPPVPPPPQVGYYSPPQAPPAPYSPGYDNSMAVAMQPPMAPPAAMVPAPPPQHSAHPPHYQAHATGPDLSRTTVVGYELLANKLSGGPKVEPRQPDEDTVVPMYRKFEQLNHRVLLHLQDEISELEEELRYLDECIAQCSPRNGAGLVQPASRRGDARYGGDVHFRRTELLGRIYLKLGQYNSALSSFNSMVRDVDTAGSNDVQAYQAWLEKRTPIDYAETRFLQHGTDLLAVSRGRSASTAGGVHSHQSAAIFLPLILVLPLMAFAMVPGLVGRLFILMATGGGIIKVITSTEEVAELMTAREWTGCFSVYFGLMAVLAALH